MFVSIKSAPSVHSSSWWIYDNMSNHELRITALSSRLLLAHQGLSDESKVKWKDGLYWPLATKWGVYLVPLSTASTMHPQLQWNETNRSDWEAALLLVFSLPQNKADLPLVTSKSAEMITRALRSITVSTCHQKVSEKADRRHKSDQGSNNSKPDVKGNDAEVSNSSALPSLPLLQAVNHFIPSLLLLLVLVQKCKFPPFKASWVKKGRKGWGK